MKLKIIISLLLGCTVMHSFMTSKVSAEALKNEQFERLSIDEGLSNEHITAIFQDSKGYMWIGTKDGLNRFDGERTKIYNCSTDENTLSSTYIEAIEEDSFGNIWVGTDNGLDIIVRDTDTIIRMKDQKEDKFNLGELEITSLLNNDNEENIMWVGTENGLMKINIENETIELFHHDKNNKNSLTNSSITCLEQGEDNSIWVGTKSGVNLIDKNKNISYNETLIYKNKLFINNIEYDDSGKVWVCTKEGIFIVNSSRNQRESIWMLDEKYVRRYDTKEEKTHILNKNKNKDIYNNNSVLVDSKGNAWISSSNGIKKYLEYENIDILNSHIDYDTYLSDYAITSIYEDFNGTVWVGSENGAYILSNQKQFNSYYKENIVSIQQCNGYIWIATKYKGIYIIDTSNNSVISKINTDDTGFNLNNAYIKDLYKINDKYIVVSTNKETITFDVEDFPYTEELRTQSYPSELNYIYSDNEYIWLAYTTGFYSYSIKTGTKIDYSEDLMESNINPKSIYYILPDYKDENILWLCGTENGLVKYHKKKGVIQQYKHDSSNKNSLINDYINCMTFDNSGNLWIGTNIGLSKFDTKKKIFTSYTIVEGLTNNFINSILVDNNDNLWISTNKGLNKYDIKKGYFIKFAKMDGINGYQFNLNSALKKEDGSMIFGSTSGITYFNPDNIVNHEIYINKAVIGDIILDGNKLNYDGNELTLEYDNKNLYIDYFVPDYENLNNITYEYMIEGIDSDWIYTEDKSFLGIRTLKPGKYTLKIRAKDGRGNISEETRMNIRVKNTIWKTPLAYLIYIVIVLGIITYILNYAEILHKLVNKKTKSLNVQLEENKKLSAEIIGKEKFKNNYFVNLSHELRTPINVIISTVQLINSLNGDKSMSGERLEGYMDIIVRNCNNLLKIINDIIDSSKIETGQYKINRKNNDIVYIVEEAALNMSKYIEKKGLKLIIDPDIEEKIIYCDDTEIERCITNLLSNAVKFTPEGGEIRVYIKEVENNIEITVEDTGIGVSKEDQEFIFKRFSQVEGTGVTKATSSGIGLALVKLVSELHGGYVRLESEVNKGSKFTIVLPDIVEDTVCNNEI